jgi:hypothetical protein
VVSSHRINNLREDKVYFQINRFVPIFAVSFILFQLSETWAQPTDENNNTPITLPIFDCRSRLDVQGADVNPLDSIEMNTVAIPTESPIVKTIHVEKEVFICQSEGPPVTADVSIYTEIIEGANRQEPLQKNFEVVTCTKHLDGTVLWCISKQPPTDLPSLPCVNDPPPQPEFLRFPIEMNSVIVANGTIVKTIMAETEVFSCPEPGSVSHNVSKHVTLFAEKFEIINSTEPQLTINKTSHFETASCMKRDFNAEVLGCSFQTIG